MGERRSYRTNSLGGDKMTYHELRTKVRELIDEHGAEDFLLAVVSGLDATYREASDKVNEVRLELGYK